ncbi:MAG TPA: hypothetical protein VLH86_04960 [Patescibacteria group bacterium]|nr:hypothetical protein [Patescibacteria group bacterium]
MAYLNAAVIAAANQARTFDAIFDTGMPVFKNVPRTERFALIDKYPSATPWYEDARTPYLRRMAQTVGLVCTSAEGQTRTTEHPDLLIGAGMAARGLAAVVRYELQSRIGIMEARYQDTTKGAHNRAFSGLIKNGPAEAIAREAGFKDRPDNIDSLSWWLVGDLTTKVGRQIGDMTQDGVALETAALTVIEGIVPAQTDLERGVYTGLPIAWPPQPKA